MVNSKFRKRTKLSLSSETGTNPCMVIVRRPDFVDPDEEFLSEFISQESCRLVPYFRPSNLRLPYGMCSQLIGLSSEPYYLNPRTVIIHHLTSPDDFVFGSRLDTAQLSAGPFEFRPLKIVDRNGEPSVMHAARMLELIIFDVFFYFPHNSEIGKEVTLTARHYEAHMHDWIVVNTFSEAFHDDWYRLFRTALEFCTRPDWFQVKFTLMLFQKVFLEEYLDIRIP